MKRPILQSVFFVLLFVSSTIFSIAQTTVTFNELTGNTELSLNSSNTYDNSGVRFQIFSGSNSNAWVSSANSGFAGTRALDDNNTSIGGNTGWKIRKVDGTAFQFLSIWLQEGCNCSSPSGTIKAYKSGSQVGSTVNVTFDSETTGAKNFASNPDFYNVDEIRIEGVDLYVLIDNFSFGTAINPVDADPPVVTSISLQGNPLSTATSVNYTVVFSKTAMNVSTDDFQVTTGGTTGTVGAVTGSGSTYTVTINGIDGEGTIRLDLKSGTNISNVDNNTGTPAFTSGQLHYVGACFIETFETETDASTTFSGNGVTFSLGTGFEIEKKNGFGAGSSNGYVKNNNTAGSFSLTSGSEFTMKTIDLYLSNTANSTAPTATGTITITGKKGGANQYTITKSSGFPTTLTTNNGFFTIDFSTDGAGNYRNINVDELVFTISGGFIELAVDNMNFCEAAPDVDSQAPVVQSILKIGNPVSTSSTVSFQVTFDEPASNVTLDDFTLLKTGATIGSLTSISGSGSVYTLGVSGISGEGSIQIKLNENTDIEDALGNTPPFEYLNGEIHLSGGCYIETFETFSDGATTFSSNGKAVTLGGNWAVNDRGGFGINSSDIYLENTGAGPYTLSLESPVQFTKLALFLTSNTGTNPPPTNNGTVTIRGKNGASTEFEITKSTDFPTDFSSNNGFFYIDFATEGGVDNSNMFVDGLEIVIGGSFVYLALDNFEFCSDFEAPSGYSVQIDQDLINAGNASNVSFSFADAEIGATYNYTFSTSGGATTVIGNGTIASATDQITGIDLSGLEDGTITLSVTLTDPSGNTGDPATDTSVKAPNNIPVATPPTAPVVTEDDVDVALADDIQVADADGDDQTLTFTITGGTVTLGTTGITFGGSGNGSASFTAAGTLAALNTALDAATFTPTPDLFGTNAGTIEFVSNDGTADSDPASVTFNITGVNDAPVFDGNRVISYTEGGTAAKFNGGGNIGLSDIEGDDIIEAKITFNDKITGDVLSVEAPSPYSVTQEGDVITLSGTGSVAQMITALESIEYSHIGNDPTLGGTDNSRNISILVKDASGLSSNSLVVQVSITGINDDPTLAGLPTDISVIENTASNVDLSAATFEDVDAGANDISLKLAVSLGTLAASDAGGVTVGGSGTVNLTLTGTASEIDAYLNTTSNIQYTGPLALTGDNAATLTVTANDGGNTGTGGGTDVSLGTVNIDILNAQPSVTLSLSPTSKAENLLTDNIVTATLSNTFTSAVTVNLSFSGTATNTTDYTRSGSSIVIPIGELTGTIVINNVNDGIYEGDETVIVDISSVTNGLENGTQQVTYTIEEDDSAPTVTIAADPISISEAAETTRITVTLSAAAGVDVTIPIEFTGDAVLATDYNFVDDPISSFIIVPGSTSLYIDLISIPNGIVDGDRDIVVSLGTLTNGTPGAEDEATVTITDDDTAELSIAATTDAAEDAIDGLFTITTTKQFSADVTVNFTVGGSATEGTDYASIGTSIVFPANQNTITIPIDVTADNIVEGDESVSITMTSTNNPSVTISAVDNASITIIDDETAVLSIVATTQAAEDNTNGVFTVSTSKQFATATDVTFNIAGTATSGTDYSALGSSFTFPAFTNSVTITVTVTADDLVEADETVIVTLTGTDNAGVTIGSTDDATITITDDDSATLSIAATNDAAEDATDGLFTISTTNQFSSAVTVDISISGTATEGTDYANIGTSVTFPANQNSVTISVPVNADDLVEADETVIVTLTGTDNSAVTIAGADEATVTIADDDTAELSIAATTDAAEDATDGLFTITTTKQFSSAVTVNITVGGSATEGTDYASIGTSIVFPANQNTVTIPIDVTADNIVEGEESVSISISSTNNAAVSISATSNASITIADNDTPPDVPPAPDLDSSSDTGSSDIDDITSDNTPTFTGTAQANYTVEVFSEGASLGTTTANGDGDWSFTSGTMSDGSFQITVIAKDSFDNESDESEALTITIDTSDPAKPSTTDLSADSDSGRSNTDNITNDVTPTLSGSAEANSVVTINSTIDGDVGTALVTAGGLWSFTPGTDMSTGVHSITIIATDAAGNSSLSSDALSLTIDTKAPSPELINSLTVELKANGNSLTLVPADFLASILEDDYSAPEGILVELNVTSFDCSDIGNNLIKVTATDEAGNSDFAESNALVKDLIGPVVNAKSSIVLNVEAFGNVTLLPGMVDEGSTDACGILSKTFSQSVFDRTDEGINNITYTVTDINGNPSQVNIAVTIVVVPKVLNITANASQSKIYGSADPVFTYTATGFESGDDETIITGALSRVAGENVGSYAIQLGTLNAGPNYSINFVSNDFEITYATLSLVADSNQSKIYGETDPILTYTATGFVNGDTEVIITGSLARGLGENVGDYAINAGSLDAGANYTINFTTSDFEITKATLDITANSGQSKVYGDVDPVITYAASGFKNGDTDVILTGGLARTAGEDVDTYPINLGTLNAGDNYTINYTGANFEITKATLDISADAGQSKVFGAADPIFLYTATGFENGDTDAVLTGVLSRDAGEDIGTYAIELGTLSAGSNYTINYTAADFTIASKILNVIAESGQSKVYGDADPVFTYTATGFESGDDETILTGELSRTSGENVGNYPINLGTLSAGDNYTINFTSADFEITKATLYITADAEQTKVYGDVDPVFTYATSGFKNGDTDAILTGSLIRFAGEDVGLYEIQPGTIDAGGNYLINFTSADFEISKATLSITANAGQSKVYGEADPVFTYASSGFKNGDTNAILSGSLIRFAGENVGFYAIQQGTIDAGGNYTINFTSADFEITKATLAVTANAGISKVYGNEDPTLTYQATGFKNGDTQAILSGILARAAGENVGNYAINQGSLSAGANYTINFTGANFAITQRTLYIEANPNQAKVYGSPDPVLAYSASNFGNGDTNAILTGALSRTAGENIGMYSINLGTLSAGSNYTINFTSADFEIAAKVLNVTADAGHSKIFGTADPVFTYQVTGFVNGDTGAILTGALSRVAGENVGTYAINLGTLNAGANYAINYEGADFAITKAMIIGITFTDESFVYDGTAKSLSITGTLPVGTSVAYSNNSRTDVGIQEAIATVSGSNYTTLVLNANLEITKATITGITFEDESFVYDGTAKSLMITGTLPVGATVAYSNNSRTDVGIQEVTVKISGSNFSSFELTANLEITKANLAIIADTGQSKLYGTADPILTYTASGFGAGDDASILSGILTRTAGESVGTYAIGIGTLDAGSNYLIDFSGADFEIISNDSDGDGVPDDVEETEGTDPKDSTDFKDSDGDGVPDFVEVEQGTNPTDPGDYLDTDGDDVPDYVEEQQGSDPNDSEDFLDEDEDGLPDYVQTRSISEFVTQSVDVLWGTEADNIKLPTEVVVMTAEGAFVNLPVTWDLTGYDPMISGISTYVGIVELPAGLFNPLDLQAMLEITVLAKPAPVDVTLSNNEFIGIPDQFFQEIGAFTVIDPTDNVHTLSLPEGEGDNVFFEVNSGILFWSSADQQSGRVEFTIVLSVVDRAGNEIKRAFSIRRLRTPLDQLEVPNTFTPNGDGANDTWGILALRYYTGVRIQVFDLGGNRIFYTENPDKQWDGTFEGKEMPISSYLYVIEVGETGEIRRGMLNLLRQ